jgi:hypothetical protein
MRVLVVRMRRAGAPLTHEQLEAERPARGHLFVDRWRLRDGRVDRWVWTACLRTANVVSSSAIMSLYDIAPGPMRGDDFIIVGNESTEGEPEKRQAWWCRLDTEPDEILDRLHFKRPRAVV